MRAFLPSLAAALALFSGCEPAPPRGTAPLRQDAYVWQRSHNPAVTDAMRTRAGSFHSLVVLAAEITWKKSDTGLAPQIARVPLDWPTLRTVPNLGLGIRINAAPGPLARDEAVIGAFITLARTLLAEAAAQHVRLAELQVDFDAPTAKLPGYLVWINALRAAAAPLPLTITALPAWLRSPDFAALAHATPGYVLQVHSIARPRDADEPAILCDPDAARGAIERAARLNVPFRVALPTYGYTLTFDSAGHFVGLSAEGARPGRPEGSIVHEVRSDPAQLAGLVRSLAADHPAMLTGIIWYRLPVAGDQLNWSWPTLAAVMRGRAPSPHLRAVAQAQSDGSFAFSVFNDGEGDFIGPLHVAARWHDAQRTGADALAPFLLATQSPTALGLAATNCILPAGAHRPIGWLKLSNPASIPDVRLEN